MRYPIILTILLFASIIVTNKCQCKETSESTNPKTKVVKKDKRKVLDENSFIKSKWGIVDFKTNVSVTDIEYKKANKYEYFSFLNFDINKTSDFLQENDITKTDTIPLFGELLRLDSIYAGAGCNSEHFYIASFSDVDVIFGYSNDYYIFTSEKCSLLEGIKIGNSADLLLKRHTKPFEHNDEYISYLCFNRVETMHGDGENKFYTPLIFFFLKKGFIEKVLVIFPWSC